MIKVPKVNMKGTGKVILMGAKKKAPAIMIVAGIAGMGVAAYSAYKAGPKALNAIETEKNRINDERYAEAKEKNYDNFEEVTGLSVKDTIRVTWKIVMPTLAIFGGSAALILGGNHIWAKRNAVLAAGYAILDKAYQEYTTKAVEVLGPKKEKEIRQAVADEHIAKNSAYNNYIVSTDHGDTLCYDCVTGRYFKSSKDHIDRIVNILNKRMLTEMYISLNEFYMEIEIPPVDIGDSIGWNIDNGLIEPVYSTSLTDDGTPCLVLSYLVKPRYDYGL